MTVGEAIERYVKDKTEASRRGERRGWSDYGFSATSSNKALRAHVVQRFLRKY